MGCAGALRFGRTVLCFAILAAAPALAQAPANSDEPEVSSTQSAATFRSKVNLVTVPVVVRDRQRNAVGDLKKEDFQVFDRGKLQAISKFAIERADVPNMVAEEMPAVGAAGESPKPFPAIANQFVAYVFDDLHLDAANLSVVRTAAERNIAELAPDARAAIFTTSGVTMLDFTNDRATLKDALARLQAQSRAGTKKTDCPYISYYMADLILNENDPAALEAAMMEAINCGTYNELNAEALVKMTSKVALGIGDMEARITVRSLKEIVRRVGAMPGQRAVVLVSPGFIVKGNHFEVGGVIESANRLNVRINCLDARGVYLTGADATDRPVHTAEAQMLLDSYARDDAMAHSGALEEFAEETGGQFFHNDNGLYEGFHQLATPPAFVYWLGFSPANLPSDGKFHTLKVTLKNSGGLSIQSRRGYFAPSQGATAGEQAKQEMEDALFSRQEMHDIPIVSIAQFLAPATGGTQLSLVAGLDIRGLQFRQQGGKSLDRLTVACALFDRDGHIIKAKQQRFDLRLKDATVQSGSNDAVAVRTNFIVMPGTYVIRLVVSDSEGQMMSATNSTAVIP